MDVPAQDLEEVLFPKQGAEGLLAWQNSNKRE